MKDVAERSYTGQGSWLKTRALAQPSRDLYDAQPSRDLWKAIMVTWLEHVHKMCTGCFNDYYLKCTLDRLLAIRKIDHGTISWWPTMCPAYQEWFKRLYPGKDLSSEERFQVLCKTYITLNQYKTCTFAEALAQTCWLEKESHGRLHVDTRASALLQSVHVCARFCYRANHESVSLESQLFFVDVCARFCYRANHESLSLDSPLFCVDVCS